MEGKPERDRGAGPEMHVVQPGKAEATGFAALRIGLDLDLEQRPQRGPGPGALGEEIVRLRQRKEPRLEGGGEVAEIRCRAQGLGGERLDRRERVLNPMIELVDQELALLLRLLALGDVDQAADHPLEAPVGVALGDGAVPDPDPVTVAMTDPVLRLVLRSVVLEQRPARLVIGGPVLGMDALVPGVRNRRERRARLADDLQVALRALDAIGGRVVIGDAALKGLRREPETLLAFGQSRLELLVIVDLDRGAGERARRARGVPDRRHQEPVPAIAAVAILETQVYLEIAVLGRGLPSQCVEQGTLGRVDDPVAGGAVAAETLAVTIADAPVAVEQGAVRPVDPEQARDRIGERRPPFGVRRHHVRRGRCTCHLQPDRPVERREPAHQLVDGDPVRAAGQHLRKRRLVGAAELRGTNLRQAAALQRLGEGGDQLRLRPGENIGRGKPPRRCRHRLGHTGPSCGAPSDYGICAIWQQ